MFGGLRCIDLLTQYLSIFLELQFSNEKAKYDCHERGASPTTRKRSRKVGLCASPTQIATEALARCVDKHDFLTVVTLLPPPYVGSKSPPCHEAFSGMGDVARSLIGGGLHLSWTSSTRHVWCHVSGITAQGEVCICRGVIFLRASLQVYDSRST